MRRSLLIAAALVCVASVVMAGTDGALGIFGDPGATTCGIIITPVFAVVTWGYVVHTNVVSGASAAEFDLRDEGDCWVNAKPWLYTELAGVAVGGVGMGISHGYGGCFTGNKAIASLSAFLFTDQPNCCFLSVVAHPVTGGPTMVDCVAIFPVPSGQAIVSPDPSCNCNFDAVREKTWGGIKALFEQ